ncbi:MAG: acyl-CoA thioesterase [Actinomycetota bacterium]
MKLVDTAAGLAASKHCGGLAVTAAMDEMSFIEPVFVGDVVTVKATVNVAWSTSMEVGVRVEAENVRSGRHTHTSSAYLRPALRPSRRARSCRKPARASRDTAGDIPRRSRRCRPA